MNDIVNVEPAIESIARFQSLQAGHYWRARSAIIEEGIDADEVLLLESIRWVDNAPHTIIMRPHPTKIGKDVQLDIPQADGSVRKKYFQYNGHRFLLADFLAKFEFEPDHQRIRTEELQQVQGRVSAIQSELMEAQSNPAVLVRIVEEKLREEAEPSDGQSDSSQSDGNTEASAGVGTSAPASTLPAPIVPGRDLAAMATGTVSDAIGTGITVEGIAALKNAANHEHKVATIKSNWIQDRTKLIAETITAMTPFYQEQAAAALAGTEDVRTYVSTLMTGIESLNLYVGKDVDVLTIRTGESAPRTEPLTFVQKKLLMDEELAVYVDVDSWFDFSKQDKFMEALCAHEGLVDQIFPTKRCVLVMAATRRDIDYGNGYENAAKDEENKKVFMLVRDGMNLYRITSPVESHLGTARLFPSKDDQDRVFRGVFGENINFEDVAYTDRLRQHERFAMHYKRFLLLVCGLDHRLKLFGDFYDGPQSMSFVSMAFQEQYCRFLHDDDGLNMLPGEKRQPIYEWISEKNSYLRSGARVLCNWHELMNPNTAPGACKPYGRGEGFDRRYSPENNIDVAIVYKDGDSLCVDIEVSGNTYSSGETRRFKCKVNLSKFESSKYDYEDQPFLCLDAVRPSELHWYIHNRDNRRQHLSYIRFFKKAHQFVQQELATQQDTRERLAKALADGNIASGDEAQDIIAQAVIAWRAANRGKDLPRFENGTAPAAWTSLLDQMFMLAGEGVRRVSDIESFVTDLGYAPLRLVLSGGAKLVVYAAPAAQERDDRLEAHPWVHRITIEKGKTKYTEKARRWALLPKSEAAETTLHQWDTASVWAGLESVFQSFERKKKLFEFAGRFSERLQPFTSQLSETEYRNQLDNFNELRSVLLSGSKVVLNPRMAVPFGIVLYPKSKTLTFLCVGVEEAQSLLSSLAPDEQTRDAFHKRFLKVYSNPTNGRRTLNRAPEWNLVEVDVSLADAEMRYGVFFHPNIDIGSGKVGGQSPCNPLLSDWLEGRLEEAQKYAKRDNRAETKFWFAEGVIDSVGRLVLDDMLGIELPDDFEPVRVVHIAINCKEGDTLPKYNAWYDIVHGKEKDSESAGSGFWPASGRSNVWTLHKDGSSPAGAFSWSQGSSSQSYDKRSPDAARKFIQSEAKSKGRMARAASESPDAPQPPAGMERWYLLEPQS